MRAAAQRLGHALSRVVRVLFGTAASRKMARQNLAPRIVFIQAGRSYLLHPVTLY